MPRSANRCRPSTTTACCSRRSRPPSIWSGAARSRSLEQKRGRGPRPTGVALQCHTSVERLSRMSVSTPIRAARGTQLSARGWQQEAALRMLCNNLDPEVAERPEDLVVYGGTGKAARDWPAFHAIVAALRRLKDDETLLVQSGKPVGIFATHEAAPRVLIANSLLVPRWATWEKFWELERLGLIMYGQMTAGSWIYIGSQGILQGTYETFGALAAKRFDGTLRGRIVLTSGLGGMGGAQPPAGAMDAGGALCVEGDATRIERRIKTGYLEQAAPRPDEAGKLGGAA